MIPYPFLKKILYPFILFVPFIFFLSGYFTLDLLLHRSHTTTPNVLGRSLPEALRIISAENLNIRLLSYKEDEQSQEGTILSQNPSPASSIRPQQTVFLIASCKPREQKNPTCIGKSYDLVTKDLKEQNLCYKIHYVSSNHPKRTCIAQIPDPGKESSPTPLILYFSEEVDSSLILLPFFNEYPVQEVISFLTEAAIPFSLFHAQPLEPDHTCATCVIKAQKPLGGSFIDKRNPPTIQLKVND